MTYTRNGIVPLLEWQRAWIEDESRIQAGGGGGAGVGQIVRDVARDGDGPAETGRGVSEPGHFAERVGAAVRGADGKSEDAYAAWE